MSLLDTARKAPGRKLSPEVKSDFKERLDLALAYASREITASQAAAALGCKVGNVGNKLASVFISAIRSGLIEAKLK